MAIGVHSGEDQRAFGRNLDFGRAGTAHFEHNIGVFQRILGGFGQCRTCRRIIGIRNTGSQPGTGLHNDVRTQRDKFFDGLGRGGHAAFG